MTRRVGVLALQGNYALHQKALQALSIEAPLVYKPDALDTLDGLVVPGGESTALLKLMAPFHWQDAIKAFKKSGRLLFGTCAGMILFANDVSPAQESLGLIDITVQRNAYGRQCDSHVSGGVCDSDLLGVSTCEMVFIRAPKVTRVGSDVRVLATCDALPVLLQQDNVLCASFHPELSVNHSVHALIDKML